MTREIGKRPVPDTLAGAQARIRELEAAIEGGTDAQVRQIKKQVREVAIAYGMRHNWCREVERALEEAGLGQHFTRITVMAMVPVGVTAEVDAEEWEALSEEGRVEAVTTWLKMDPRVALGTARNVRSVAATPEVIEVAHGEAAAQLAETNNLGRITTVEGVQVPAGYAARYSSDDGRVRHYVSTDERGAVPRNAYAICGVTTWQWRETSSRAEGGRVCTKCTVRAQSRGLL